VINLAANRGFLNSVRDMIFFRINGIFRIVGTPYQASKRNSPQSSGGIYVRESTCLALRLKQIGGVDTADPEAWSLKYTKKEIFDAKTLCKCLSKKILVIAPGTKQPIKDWGQDRWAQLIGHVAKILPEWSLVLIGSKDEKERCEELRRLWNGNSLNLCGITSPRLSGAVLSLSSLFVGVDSGPMHLASASGARVIGIFSGNNPEGQWSPGSAEWDRAICLHPTNSGPWKEKYRISPPQSLLPVSVDAVIKAIRNFSLT
jgi:ADP-heptose:LPS heptosyltransferase